MKTSAAFTSLCASILIATVASAGTLSRDTIANDATWIAHVDFDQLRETALGRHLLDEMQKPEAETKFTAFQAMFRFDPRRDLRAVTMYGVGANHEDAVALINGRFDADHLVTLVKANDTYQSRAHRQYTIHSWIDDKKKKADGTGPRTHAAVHLSGNIVFGRTAELVALGLDVLDGHTGSLKDGTAFPELGGVDNAVFLLATADFSALSTLDPKAAILQKTKSGSLTVRENGDHIEVTARVEANDATTAGQIQSIAQGLVALMNLQTQDPNATRIAQGISLNLNGHVVTGTLRLPAADVVRICQEKEACKHRAP